LTFASGDVEGVVHVAIRGDRIVEPDEALSVGLSDPSNAKLGDASAPLTIDDHEPLALAVTSPPVSEGNRGTTPATFTVALDGAAPAGSSVSVDYHGAGVTATVPGDVAPASGTLTFAAGVELGRCRIAGRLGIRGSNEVRRRTASRLDGSRCCPTRS
jgi:Calx-beta domain-containing protein